MTISCSLSFSQSSSHSYDVGQLYSLNVSTCTYGNCTNPSPNTTYYVTFAGGYTVSHPDFSGSYIGNQTFNATGTGSCSNLNITFDSCGTGVIDIVSWCASRTYNFTVGEPEPSSWATSNVYQSPSPGCSGSSVSLYVNNAAPGLPPGSRAALGQTYDTVWYTGGCGGTQVHVGGVYNVPSPVNGAIYYVRLEPAGAGCGTNSSCKQITLNITSVSAPTGTADTDSICSGDNYTLPSGTCSSGVLVWYDNSSGTGTTYSGTVSPTASTTYYPFCENGGCQSISGSVADVTVFNLSAPTSVNSSPSSVCVSGTVNLSGSGCGSGNILRWYDNAAGTGSPLQGGNPSPSATAVSGNNTFYAFCYNSSSGCQSSSGALVTVGISSPPSAPSPVSGGGDVCAGSSVTLSTSCVSGIVLWYVGGCGVAGVGSGNSLTFTAPSTPNTYYARCYESANPSGCEYSDCDTVVVTPVDPPTVPTGISVSADTGCSGYSSTLSATCASGIVRWYTSPIGTGVGESNPYSVSNDTTLYVRCYDSSKPASCQYSNASAGIDLHVLPIPSAPTGTSYSSDTCNDYNLIGTCATGSILWFDNSSMTGSPVSSPVTVNQATTYYGFCDAGPTVDSACRYSVASSGVSIIPYIYVTGNGGNQGICPGDSLDLSGMRSCSNGVLVWYLNSAGTGASYTTVSPTSTTVYYPFCEALPCKSIAGNSISISVNSLPSVATLLNSSPAEVCNPGGSVTLSGTCSSSTLKWYYDSNLASLISGGSNPSVSVSAGNQTFYAVCESDSGCLSSIDSVTIGLVDPPSPPTTVSVSDTLDCPGYLTTLSGTCATGVIRWYTSPSGTGVGESNPYTVNSLTSLYARCFDSSNPPGCQYSNAVSVTVNVNSTPSNPISLSSDKDTICLTDSAVLTATGCTTFEWYNNPTGTGTPLATNSGVLNVSPTTNTAYYVFCIDNGCLSAGYQSTTIVVDSCQTTTIDQIAGFKVKYYPNPFTDNVILEIDDLSGSYSVEVLNIQGKLVKVFNNINKGVNTLSVDDIERGVYVFSLKDRFGEIRNSYQISKQ